MHQHITSYWHLAIFPTLYPSRHTNIHPTTHTHTHTHPTTHTYLHTPTHTPTHTHNTCMYIHSIHVCTCARFTTQIKNHKETSCGKQVLHTKHLVSSIEGYLLCISDESRMYVSEVAISPSFLSYKLPKRGRKKLEYVARHKDHAEPQDARIVGVLPSFLCQTSKSYRHQHDIEKRLTDMWVDVCYGWRKSLDVFGEWMIRIGQSTIKVAHSIVGLAPKVEQVGIVNQACSDCKCQLALKKTYQTIDKSGRNGNKKPVDAVLEK